uniref:Uncharacterized protein n=1 Tax=Chromera velia CCMP2878 TaxID=1169474 RepID=A0A0G4HTL0_9ALVE|eukprot:Cvel_8435.t1-p1 / transcript=Cvel_8435.t1 / gene=Cvel_8435 / organism=Chromera_velia_CCMP2878 / gene_product=hypothetical protein / transcript_product=hypothetical protein / location=Cvel_scaffold466:1972-7601(-) / protein_length=751 / sequence_SO=supercontig / SO=protein_coding / is_pseudo=false
MGQVHPGAVNATAPERRLLVTIYKCLLRRSSAFQMPLLSQSRLLSHQIRWICFQLEPPSNDLLYSKLDHGKHPKPKYLHLYYDIPSTAFLLTRTFFRYREARTAKQATLFVDEGLSALSWSSCLVPVATLFSLHRDFARMPTEFLLPPMGGGERGGVPGGNLHAHAPTSYMHGLPTARAGMGTGGRGGSVKQQPVAVPASAVIACLRRVSSWLDPAVNVEQRGAKELQEEQMQKEGVASPLPHPSSSSTSESSLSPSEREEGGDRERRLPRRLRTLLDPPSEEDLSDLAQKVREGLKAAGNRAPLLRTIVEELHGLEEKNKNTEALSDGHSVSFQLGWCLRFAAVAERVGLHGEIVAGRTPEGLQVFFVRFSSVPSREIALHPSTSLWEGDAARGGESDADAEGSGNKGGETPGSSGLLSDRALDSSLSSYPFASSASASSSAAAGRPTASTDFLQETFVTTTGSRLRRRDLKISLGMSSDEDVEVRALDEKEIVCALLKDLIESEIFPETATHATAAAARYSSFFQKEKKRSATKVKERQLVRTIQEAVTRVCSESAEREESPSERDRDRDAPESGMIVPREGRISTKRGTRWGGSVLTDEMGETSESPSSGSAEGPEEENIEAEEGDGGGIYVQGNPVGPRSKESLGEDAVQMETGGEHRSSSSSSPSSPAPDFNSEQTLAALLKRSRWRELDRGEEEEAAARLGRVCLSMELLLRLQLEASSLCAMVLKRLKDMNVTNLLDVVTARER